MPFICVVSDFFHLASCFICALARFPDFPQAPRAQKKKTLKNKVQPNSICHFPPQRYRVRLAAGARELVGLAAAVA